MAKYRNTKTGLVTEVPDTAPTRQERRGRDKQWAGKLTGMAKSKRWERVDDSTPTGMPARRPTRKKATGNVGGGAGPRPAEVRAWAKETGVEVPEKGKIPDDVVEAYKAAQG